jgi:ADP-L-glycero-D-manno-heptose 6-epimerase
MSSVAFKAFNQIRERGRLRLFKSHNPKYKDGEQLRDFVYVKDITRWMREMMNTPFVSSGIYNMGYGQARTWLDLAKNVFNGMDKPLNIDWIDVPENIRNQYQYFTEAKMDRLMDQKLSPPQWPLEKGVQDYVQNFLIKKDPYL